MEPLAEVRHYATVTLNAEARGARVRAEVLRPLEARYSTLPQRRIAAQINRQWSSLVRSTFELAAETAGLIDYAPKRLGKQREGLFWTSARVCALVPGVGFQTRAIHGQHASTKCSPLGLRHKSLPSAAHRAARWWAIELDFWRLRPEYAADCGPPPPPVPAACAHLSFVPTGLR